MMNIALIAHDAKKKLMQNFCIAYRGILSKNELYATGTTGRLRGGHKPQYSQISGGASGGRTADRCAD